VIVVSDTSPITNLAAIRQLHLLRQLYEQIVIPRTVYNELTRLPDNPGGIEVQSYDWVVVKSAEDTSLVNSLLSILDPGEAEAIALASESNADLLLIDERIGRRVAEGLNLRPIGLLGVLLEAKHRRYVPTIKPLIDDLVQIAGFRISQPLRQTILDAAGES